MIILTIFIYTVYKVSLGYRDKPYEIAAYSSLSSESLTFNIILLCLSFEQESLT